MNPAFLAYPAPLFFACTTVKVRKEVDIRGFGKEEGLAKPILV